MLLALQAQALYCVCLNVLIVTPSMLYFPVRDLHPSVIPLSTVPQTRGFLTGRCWEVEDEEQNCQCGVIDRKVTQHR
ncbi:hypothetical protein CRENBAI_005331, partial [Crenichthys baileyi]